MAVGLVATGALLCGCSSSALIDSVPASLGGLPEGTPERPATPTPFPSVHDIPPPRADTRLSEEERKRLKEDLAASRDQVEHRAGVKKSEPKKSEPKKSDYPEPGTAGATRNP
jgi:hypothetical protein